MLQRVIKDIQIVDNCVDMCIKGHKSSVLHDFLDKQVKNVSYVTFHVNL